VPFLAQILWTPSNPAIGKHLAALANLRAFAVRIRDRYYSAPAAAR